MSGLRASITVLFAVLALLLAPMASAHLLAPALLELNQLPSGDYDVHWRVATVGTQRQSLRPRLPSQCHELTPPTLTSQASGAIDLQWRVRCTPAELRGSALSVDGLSGSGVNVILRISAPPAAPIQALLDEAHPSFVPGAPPAKSAVFNSYLQLGISHLLSGLDHLLFLLGLLLLVRGSRMLLFTITAFTLGHSVTLSLATLGLIRVPQALAELGIALTIVVLAQQLARPSQAKATRLMRRPWLMAFSFGLLHGLGFAGALAEIGLPQSDLPLALFAFNIGIEAGQLGIVAVALLLAAIWQRLPLANPRTQQALRWGIAYGIGALAALWCFERAALFWI